MTAAEGFVCALLRDSMSGFKRSSQEQKSVSKITKARKASRHRTSKPQAAARPRAARPPAVASPSGFGPGIRSRVTTSGLFFVEREKSLGVDDPVYAQDDPAAPLPSVHAPLSSASTAPMNSSVEGRGGPDVSGLPDPSSSCRFHDVDADLFQGLGESDHVGRAVHAPRNISRASKRKSRRWVG